MLGLYTKSIGEPSLLHLGWAEGGTLYASTPLLKRHSRRAWQRLGDLLSPGIQFIINV